MHNRYQVCGELFTRVREWLPAGKLLNDQEWERRHRGIIVILWAHAIFIAIFGIQRGYGVAHSLMEGSLLMLAAAIASLSGSRGWRSGAATVGLLMSSSLLVHLSGGLIEAHFHFFVMVGLLTLYQDWLPFLLAIGFVVGHHAVVGALDPAGVFNHSAAQASPWKWALIHGVFVAAASVAHLFSWRVNEISRLEAAESYRRLRSSEERFRSLVQNAPDAISVIDADARITYTSPSAMGVIGYEPEELVGRVGLEFVHPDDVERVAAALDQVVERPGALTVLEVRFKHVDGTWRWLEARLTNLLDDPNVAGIVVNYRDIDERKRLESKLTHQAFHDPLTELPNRVYFLDRLGHALSRVKRVGEPAAVMFVDLDKFKPINDTMGHEIGDRVLIEVARRLERAIRAVDTAARLGGDEFAVLLEAVSLEAIGSVVERIKSELGAPMSFSGRELEIHASVGVCVSKAGRETPSELLRNADLAMYLAKSRGNGLIEIFEPEMLSEALTIMQMKADLKEAIANDELSLFYQPIVDLESGRIEGIEALARWFHPARGLISPGEFVPCAEETGLIVPMGAQLLRRACDTIKHLRATNHGYEDLWVSVNVSARELRNPGFVDGVLLATEEVGVPPDAVVLEVTESLLMEDVKNVAGKLESLRKRGFRVAIDDFGTGQSSLSWIANLPATIMKIDRSFVAHLDLDVDKTLTETMVKLADALSMDVIAEGIERTTQLATVRGLGSRWGQGFLFSRPVDVGALEDLLEENIRRPFDLTPAIPDVDDEFPTEEKDLLKVSLDVS